MNHITLKVGRGEINVACKFRLYTYRWSRFLINVKELGLVNGLSWLKTLVKHDSFKIKSRVNVMYLLAWAENPNFQQHSSIGFTGKDMAPFCKTIALTWARHAPYKKAASIWLFTLHELLYQFSVYSVCDQLLQNQVNVVQDYSS